MLLNFTTNVSFSIIEKLEITSRPRTEDELNDNPGLLNFLSGEKFEETITREIIKFVRPA